MERKVQKRIEIPEGKHTGTIIRVEENEYGDKKKYKYIDVFIDMDEREQLKLPEGFELKHGCSDWLSKTSKLGRLLANFTEVKDDEVIDPEKILVNKRITFMTLNEEKESGVYATVVDKSIKPLISGEKTEGKPEPEQKKD